MTVIGIVCRLRVLLDRPARLPIDHLPHDDGAGTRATQRRYDKGWDIRRYVAGW